MRPLVEYKRDIYSQFGEDGIIAEILVRLRIEIGYFVEFGAWDGIQFSNCRSLYDNGWSGCFIEGNPKRFEALTKTTPEYQISKICAFVKAEGENSLDELLRSVNAPRDIDVLSIDIDSDDYAVWNGLREHTAKIVVIEFNPTIPNACRYVQPEGAHIGNSAAALCDLAAEKGLDLAAVTHCNLIFVRSDLVIGSGIEPKTLNEIREEFGFLFHAYDGRIIAVGNTHENPWTRIHIHEPLTRSLLRQIWLRLRQSRRKIKQDLQRLWRQRFR